MAIIFQRKTREKVYEVRSAGQSLRLYTNGVFHTQWNPRVPFKGQVWDLMALPALLMPEGPLRVLVLGVGGGAVIQQIHTLNHCAHITGVDIDAKHLQIAKKYFGVKGKGVRLVHADAVAWVKDAAPDQFDYIVDDLFGESSEDPTLPTRAVPLSPQWLGQLKRIGTQNSVIVTNSESLKHIKKAALGYWGRSKPSGFVTLQVPRYENAMGVFTMQPGLLERLAHEIKTHPQTRKAATTYKVRTHRSFGLR